MTTSTRDGDQEIAVFRRVITEALGHEDWPGSVAGDLSHLLFTLERGAAFLRELMDSPGRDETPRKLLQVELWLADELGGFVTDLLPAVRKICKEAYSAAGDEAALGEDD